MLERGHISQYSEYVLFSTPSVYSTLIVVVLRDYDADFLTIVDVYLFYDGAVDTQIRSLLTKSQCRVSDTPVVLWLTFPCKYFRLKGFWFVMKETNIYYRKYYFLC